MHTKNIVLPMLLAVIVGGSVQAGSSASLGCPASEREQMDAEFGEGTSEITRCLSTRDGIKVMINFSGSTLHKSGVAQQLKNIENIVNNYEHFYGMKANKNYHIVVVGYGPGGRFLINDAAYNATYGGTAGNPSRPLVESLIARGVYLVMCQNTMRSNRWVTADIISGISQVPAGVTAVIDYEYAGYKALNP